MNPPLQVYKKVSPQTRRSTLSARAQCSCGPRGTRSRADAPLCLSARRLARRLCRCGTLGRALLQHKELESAFGRKKGGVAEDAGAARRCRGEVVPPRQPHRAPPAAGGAAQAHVKVQQSSGRARRARQACPATLLVVAVSASSSSSRTRRAKGRASAPRGPRRRSTCRGSRAPRPSGRRPRTPRSRRALPRRRGPRRRRGAVGGACQGELGEGQERVGRTSSRNLVMA